LEEMKITPAWVWPARTQCGARAARSVRRPSRCRTPSRASTATAVLLSELGTVINRGDAGRELTAGVEELIRPPALGTGIRSAPAAESGPALAWIPHDAEEQRERGTGRGRGQPMTMHRRGAVASSTPRAVCDVLVLRLVPRMVATVTPPGLIAQGGAWGHCAHAPAGCRVTGPPSARGGSAR